MDPRASYSGGCTRATYTTQRLSILLGRLPFGVWLCVPPPACLRMFRPSGRSACPNMTWWPSLSCSFLTDFASTMQGGKNQQLGPRRVITEQVRNKKHHAIPPSCKNRTAKFRMPTQNNNFMTALFFGEPGVAQVRAAMLCNFRVSTLKTLLGKH